jgi:peptide/nickel transport system permease protein
VFRYVLRRLLWAFPTLLGVSLVVFMMTTLLPDPLAASVRIQDMEPKVFDRLTEERRSRFLDLPRFVNTEPMDVARLTDAYARHIVTGDAEASVSMRRLAALGGAALPYLLPGFENLPSAGRRRLAIALVPVARRMGRFDAKTFESPDDAALFWSRFWGDHSIDFTEPSARRAVSRLVEHGGSDREEDLYLLDTYAVPFLVAALIKLERRDAQAQVVRVLAHVAERERMVIADDASAATVRARIADWRAFWVVHETDFVVHTGGERVLATFSQTRYGKWMRGALMGDLVSQGDQNLSLADRLQKRGLLTLSLTFVAMLLSYSLAVPLGAILAYRKQRRVDRWVALLLFTGYALPSFVLGGLLLRVFGERHRAVLAVVTLSIGALATLSRYQRAAVIEVLASDYVRAARAKGVFGLRLILVHILRNAITPMVTLAGVQFPGLIGGAFVVEEVFGLRGLGYETLRAIEKHDAAWLVACILTTAVIATFSLLTADVVQGLLDPRVRNTLQKRAS